MNNYLIFGLENYLIDKKIQELKEKCKIEEDNTIKFNLSDVNVSAAILEASTVSMFQNSKFIICDDCKFLTGEDKKNIEHDIDSLIKYLSNPFDDVYLIFIVRNEKLDERKKIVKEMKKMCNLVECKKIENNDLNNTLKNYITSKGYKISSNGISLLIKKVGLDLSLLISEIDKLLLYKDDNKNITIEDINDVVIENIENNIFALTNAIMNKDRDKIFNIYNDLIKSGEDPSKLLVMLANQFRLLLQVKLMASNGYKDNEMVSILKEHPYRIKLSKENTYSKKILIDKIKKLAELDYNIKSGVIDRYLGFELFLLNI